MQKQSTGCSPTLAPHSNTFSPCGRGWYVASNGAHTPREGAFSVSKSAKTPSPSSHGAPNTAPIRLPPHPRGLKIGLFGGTFDPPHAAHRAACLIAIRRLNLDRLWWLVTPGNPLKDTRGLTPLAQRVAAARALANHPRIGVSGFEAEIGARYTYDTVRYLTQRCPGVHFVWIMGA